MKIEVKGISNKNIKVSITRLLKAYEPYTCRTEGKAVFYMYTIERKHSVIAVVKVGVKVYKAKNERDNIAFTEQQIVRYTVLTALYKALHHMTGYLLPWGLLNGIRPTKLVHHYRQLGLSDSEVSEVLCNSFLISEEKVNEMLDIVNYQFVTVKNLPVIEQEISIYIHIPFCLSRCTYCSFTAYKMNDKLMNSKSYVDTLCDEISMLKEVIDEKQIKITSIYIGGGTPTALSVDELSQLLSSVESLIESQSIIEYTLESGRPDTLNEEKLQLIKKFSVNRISINPQTFNNNTLRKVNREHTTEDIINVFSLARECGFQNINMDLIVGLPGETGEDYIDSLKKTIDLSPESITIHALAIKRRAQLNDVITANDLNSGFVDAFNQGKEMLEEAGYRPYYLYRQKHIVDGLENIGYCKSNMASTYNITMIEEKQPIIGLGCGASSKFLDYSLILNSRDIKTYKDEYKNYMDEKKIKINEWIEGKR